MIEAVIARAVEDICKSRQKPSINEWHKEVRIRNIRRAGDRSAIGSAYLVSGKGRERRYPDATIGGCKIDEAHAGALRRGSNSDPDRTVTMTFATVNTANLSNLRRPRTVSAAIAGSDRQRAVSRGEAGPGSI